METLTVICDLRLKPIINVTIHDGTKANTVKALIDTGCTNTSLYQGIISDMKLTDVSNGNGPLMTGIDNKEWRSGLYNVSLTIQDKIHLPVGKIAGFPVPNKDCDMILGMDVLSICNFAISDINGKTKISMVYPSLYDLDFTEE